MERQEFLKLLERHVGEITSLSKTLYFNNNYNYSKAADLYQKTKMLSNKYFPNQFYGVELIGIRFEPVYTSGFTTQAEYRKAWEDGCNKLLSIAKTMYEDATLTPVSPPQIKIVEDTSRLASLTERVKKAEEKNNELEQAFSVALGKVISEKEEYILRLKKLKKWTLFILLLIILSAMLWSFNSLLKWSWLLNHPKKIALYISFQILIIFSLLRIVIKNRTIKIVDIIIGISLVILSFL